MVGVSMGGLVCRAAAGMLWETESVAGLAPSSLCCMASPMLGIRRTLPWMAKMAIWLSGRGKEPTLADMMLDGTEDRALEQLTGGKYKKALESFNRRVVAGATHGDPLCPYSTSMLVTHAPTHEPENTAHTHMVAGHFDPPTYIPQLEGQVTQHFEEGSIEHQMLIRLRTMCWERYELFVGTQDRSPILGAHNDYALREAHQLLLETVRVGDVIPSSRM